MANIEIIILTIALASFLVVLGYLTQRRGEFLRLAGYTIFIILGLVLLTTSITFNTGNNISSSYTYSEINGSLTLSNASYVSENNYSEQNATATNIFAFVVMLVGFFGIVDTAREMNVRRKEELEADEGDVQDEIEYKD